MTRPTRIPIEEVAKYPLPGTSVPAALAFGPDGSIVTFLDSADGSLTRELYSLDLQTGARSPAFLPPGGGSTEDNLSEEEKLRRERMRERGLGITHYAWAKTAAVLMVPVRGDVWVQDGHDGVPRKVVEGGDHPALDPQLSRDGRWVAYVRDRELHVVDTATGAIKRLTAGAREQGTAHGLAEYIAQEEMDRHHGFWWSYDATRLAYTEIDETAIPTYRIVHQGRDEPSFEDHGYPFVGGPNAKVRLGVIARGGGPTRWLDTAMEGEPPDELYLARVHWHPDGSLFAQIENRAQTRLDLVRYDVGTGERTLVLSETSDVWINLHGVFEPLEQPGADLEGAFVWASERDGFRHLYLVRRNGSIARQLTSGTWMVDEVLGIDEARGIVYLIGTKDGPTERHLYRVALAGGPIEKLTKEPGMHDAVLDRAFTRYIDVWSSIDHPPRIEVRSTTSGEAIRSIEIAADPRLASLALRPPRLVRVPSSAGVELHGALYLPAGTGPFPTIVSVYGGPHAQRVQNSWLLTADMRAQYLCDQGYAVFKLDNRGSARRGLAFEGAIKHDLGHLEVLDQVDGVRWLIAQGHAIPNRVGIYGWSYGGYLAAMAVARAPEVFKAAVAGAPVTSWDGYDTHYTERYMGTPHTNPGGYQQSSVMTHVDKIAGALMLVHGLIDENVHFRHTARLVNALVKANKRHELLLFPDERHMPRAEADRVYMERRIAEFFAENL